MCPNCKRRSECGCASCKPRNKGNITRLRPHEFVKRDFIKCPYCRGVYHIDKWLNEIGKP